MICFAQINMTEVLKASELRVPMPPENMSINRDRSGEHHQNMDGPPQPAHAHFTPPTSVSDLELLQHRVNWGTFSKSLYKKKVFIIINQITPLQIRKKTLRNLERIVFNKTIYTYLTHHRIKYYQLKPTIMK